YYVLSPVLLRPPPRPTAFPYTTLFRSPRTIDHLVARGERLSAQMFAAALEAAGCPAVYVDATEVVQTDGTFGNASPDLGGTQHRSEEHTSELQSRGHLVCRLLLEKKNE